MKFRLNKAIALLYNVSRRKADEIIFSGKVFVDGVKIDDPANYVEFKENKITIDGKEGTLKEYFYYLLNKPIGYICSNKRVEEEQLLVKDLFPFKDKIVTVGRLDMNTSGILLVTNDGLFANTVMHPSSSILKEYKIFSKDPIKEDDIRLLRKGTMVHGSFSKPKHVKRINKNNVAVSIYDGKQHEVRIMARRANIKLNSLIRVKIGSLSLSGVKEGSYRKLKKNDFDLIFEGSKVKWNVV